MALGPTLPPQAYTRDVLSQAYTWIQAQPDSVKKLATTPDVLVSLYLRYQRYGDFGGVQDAPVSSQTFKSDLKHLAEDLKQFDAKDTSLPAVTTTTATVIPEAAPTPLRPSTTLEDLLDGKSVKMIQEVKATLNLSSEVEACRALISLGYERLRVALGK